MNNNRRILSVLLVAVMLLTVLPFSVLAAETDSAQTAASIDSESVSNTNAAATAAINALQQKDWYKIGSNIGQTQCYGFANAVFKSLFGSDMGYQASPTQISSSTMTEVGRYTGATSNATIKALLMKAYPGDIIQYCSTTTPIHAAVIKAVSNSGITLYHAYGGSTNGYWTVHEDYITWANVPTANGFIGSFTSSNHGIGLYHSKNYAQKFGDVYQDLGTNFYANIVVTSNTNLAVAANSSSNVLLATKANTNAQKWLFERASDKSYRITNVGMNKCLDVTGGKTDDGTNIGVYANNDKANQRWYFVKDGSGYTIVPKSCIGSAMDIKNGTIANGTSIWQYTRNQSNAQRFSVVNKANRYYIAYNANGGTGTMSSAAIGAEETLKIANCGFTRDGCLFGGYNVFRSSDSKWYVTGEGWKSNAEINAGGFTKAVYKPGETYKITGIWNSGVPAGTTYTFYPIWLLNNPKLWCYLSYSGCNYMLGSDLGDEYEAYIKSGNTSAFTVEKDESVRLNNQNSLKITVLSDDTQNNTVRFFTSTNSGRNTGSNGLFPEAGENKKYTLNFWAKSTVKNANMTLRWGWEANTRTAKLDSEWKFYSIPMNKNCNFDRCIHCNIDKKGTVWLNNLTLTVGAEGAPESYRHETECTPIVQTYTHGGKYSTLPEPEREGYTFLGWFTQPEGGTPITTNTNVVDYNAAVYAHWQKNVSDEPVQTAKSGNKRYELYDNNVTWEEAKEFCESKGGHLATVNSVEENALIASMIADKRCTVWLGAKLNESTNDWEWVTGEKFSCINWAAGKPSANSDSVYAQMIAFDTGLSAVAGCWNDQPNGSNIRNLYCKENCLFVCEYDVVPGDANGDGKVNIRDVTAIQRHVSELKLLAGKDAFSADVDGNGAVDINDATHLQRYLAEYDVQLG